MLFLDFVRKHHAWLFCLLLSTLNRKLFVSFLDLSKHLAYHKYTFKSTAVDGHDKNQLLLPIWGTPNCVTCSKERHILSQEKKWIIKCQNFAGNISNSLLWKTVNVFWFKFDKNFPMCPIDKKSSLVQVLVSNRWQPVYAYIYHLISKVNGQNASEPIS